MVCMLMVRKLMYELKKQIPESSGRGGRLSYLVILRERSIESGVDTYRKSKQCVSGAEKENIGEGERRAKESDKVLKHIVVWKCYYSF